MVAEREAYHGRVFTQRLAELGGTMADRMTDEFRKNLEYLRDTKISDLAKLKRGAERFPNPEETMRPLFEFAELLKEDQQTREMVRLFAEDELSTLKWQKAAWAALGPQSKQTHAAVAA
jgi:hypothetical protein